MTKINTNHKMYAVEFDKDLDKALRKIVKKRRLNIIMCILAVYAGLIYSYVRNKL